ncbi:MAG TPA: aminotransferase class I/II-fold pyridoxal phosphate-dependent enzyme [Thermoguttaceae bacterium]|nr:aminotransferase class I/II-fold pyridoxal phosphate-dependent enzyme [Thermoguttaceae bacterium]
MTSESASPHPDRPGLRPSTLAVHAGEDRIKPGFAITDPIFCTATYTFANTQAVIDFVDEKQPREEYGRYGNPSEKVVQRKLAALEGGETAVTFSTGMAAVAAFLLAKLQAGDEIVLFDECYHRTRQMCREMLGKFGVVTHTVPACDYDRMEAAINANTKVLISESPTNPHLSVVDLERFAALGKQHGVETLIDATLATPYNVRPLEYGVDCVLHSCTKYLGGHNDLLAGVLIGSRDVIEPIRKLRGVIGTGNSPHAIYLLQRGLKTLELRMQRHNENGLALSEFLEGHPRVEKVYYPGLASHRDHEVARRTMRGFGGLVTFLVKDADADQTAAVVDAVRLPRIGPSLGGVESLIEQPMYMSYHDFTREQRLAVGIPDNMIRVSCGIENPEDLIEDFRQALEQ